MLKILNRLFGPKIKAEAERKSEMDDFWFLPYAALTAAGVPVTPENALRVSAIWACNKVISETIAELPFLVYKRLPNGGKIRYEKSPLYPLLKDKPNNIQTSFEWRESIQTHINLYGNGYSIIKHDYYGNILGFSLPIHPTRVKVEQLEDEEILRYTITRSGKPDLVLLQDEMLHLRSTTINGYLGISPIEAGSNSIGLAMAAELFGSKFFKNNARPSSVVTHPNTLNEIGQNNLRKSIIAQSETGVLVLEEGVKFDQASATPEESQFLQTRQFQIEEVARWYRMPLHKIEHLLHATFSNIEHQALEFVTDTILPQVKRWEQRINSTIIDDNTLFVEMLLEGLLRGDTATRNESYVKRYNIGAISANEIRILENQNPYEGGDEYYRPLNMVPVNQAIVAIPQQPQPDNNDDSDGENDDNNEDESNQQQAILNSCVTDAANRIINYRDRESKKISNDPDKISAYMDRFIDYIGKVLQPFGIDIKQTNFVMHDDCDVEYIKNEIMRVLNYEIN